MAERRPWTPLPRKYAAKGKFIRGLPAMAEGVLNGMREMDRADAIMKGKDAEASGGLAAAFMMTLVLAVILLVIVPYALALLMRPAGIAPGSPFFHVWDGVLRVAVLCVYIGAAGRMPELGNVFRCHGAEHKVVACYEDGGSVSAERAARFSRLHPRCGSSFILFTVLATIFLHALIVPVFMAFVGGADSLAARAAVLFLKTALIVPAAMAAYELLQLAARRTKSMPARILAKLGLVLQYLTTREPYMDELELAVVALFEVVPESEKSRFSVPPYERNG
ncbi:MAG: DUF1385 domain-containing protein [Mailhella sp.]|nr:DUF1385 domain-containing protein [Mailhella sp.]